MTHEVGKLAVFTVNDLIVKNNPRGVTQQLKALGYQTPYDVMDPNAAKETLLKLFIANPEEYWNLIKAVPFNYNIVNESTSPDTKERILKIIDKLRGRGRVPTREETGKWWETFINLLMPTTITTQPPTIKPPKVPMGAWLAFAGIAIAIAVIIIIAIRE